MEFFTGCTVWPSWEYGAWAARLPVGNGSAKRADFAAHMTSAGELLQKNSFSEAKAAFLSARQVWPDAPAADLQKITAKSAIRFAVTHF
jgi:hypothetical protein